MREFMGKAFHAPLTDEEKEWLRSWDQHGLIQALEAEDQEKQTINPDPEETPEDEDDDYDEWTLAELEEEVAKRDPSPEVVATGKGGKALKADLIKALRLWDQENA